MEDLFFELKMEALAFLKEKPFIAAITGACNATGRSYEKTKWETDIIPLGGEVGLEMHIPAFLINNLREVHYTVPFQTPGFNVVVKFGERQFRGLETERKVTICSTVCRDDNGLYVLVRLFSTDGRTHEPGRIYTFDSRFHKPGLQAWISNMLILSESNLPEPEESVELVTEN